MDKKLALNLWYAVIAVIAVLLIQGWWLEQQRVEHLPYSGFLDLARQGKVKEIAIGRDTIRGVLTEPLPGGRSIFMTTRVEPELAAELARYNLTFTGVVESSLWRDLLSWIVPIAFFFAVWFFMFRRFAEKQGFGGLMSIGQSKAKVYVEKGIKVTFDDVAGVDEAKQELAEVIAFLKDPKSHGRLGARIPKGVLLVGPPGTGKTLLARAVAGEAGVPFFSISGSEFVELFVGVGAARVRDLFEQARKSAPCIIFVDELDALGRARLPGLMGGGHDEKEQTLNQLLAEMDGFDTQQGVVLLAATNRPEILDAALLRAGRFDRQVLVDRPERQGRVAILKVHVRKIVLGPDIDLDQMAALTPGFSGADLANLVNEAALAATRRAAAAVAMIDFTAAFERIVAGLERKSRVLNPEERRIVAHHEMGHALVAMSLPGSDKVHKISIIPRGIGALGYTLQRPTEDRFLMTREELDNKLAVLLAGRAAEKLVFDRLSTGAADDIAKATDIARGMVMRYGMDETLGEVTYEAMPHSFVVPDAMMRSPRDYSEATAREIDCAVRQTIAAAEIKAHGILAQRKEALLRGAQLLLERETLSEEDLQGLLVVQSPAAKPG
jgi:cell division protease FtsH